MRLLSTFCSSSFNVASENEVNELLLLRKKCYYPTEARFLWCVAIHGGLRVRIPTQPRAGEKVLNGYRVLYHNWYCFVLESCWKCVVCSSIPTPKFIQLNPWWPLVLVFPLSHLTFRVLNAVARIGGFGEVLHIIEENISGTRVPLPRMHVHSVIRYKLLNSW